MDETPTQPLDYAAINAAWLALLAGVVASTRSDAPPAAELPVLGMAAFSLSKALAKEKVGAWARAPVVDNEGEGRPKGSRLRFAAGELVTCTRCLGTWSALGLVGLRVARPREGRIVASVLATAALNDWLQAMFSAATSKANVEQKLAAAPLDEWPSVVDR
ncbi:MAG TPA: DUF1360 domain-containing protein [Solirubrobacteraceae bacterium]|jgi:hypothetical protein|nr:DUF1360 domain-containing protein [Solirubrobacteraceae bacterium]